MLRNKGVNDLLAQPLVSLRCAHEYDDDSSAESASRCAELVRAEFSCSQSFSPGTWYFSAIAYIFEWVTSKPLAANSDVPRGGRRVYSGSSEG
jgi:hypothetical protein